MKPGSCSLLIALALLLPARSASEETALRASLGLALPLEVRNDRCTFCLSTGPADQDHALIIGSLARQGGPFRVHIRTELTSSPPSLPIEAVRIDAASRKRVQEWATRLARGRKENPPSPPMPASDPPPRHKVFHLLTSAGSLEDQSNYTTVNADLRAVGHFCQAYLDHDHPDPASLEPLIHDAVRTFDEEIYPKAIHFVGTAVDVDRDGRFTLLFTPRLARLQSGGIPVEGFVRGSDFYRDVAAPFSNRCDMLYLSTDLRPGPRLRTILAHEYTHAVVFCGHVLTPYLPGLPQRAEESWLDEGLAHLAEEAHGYSWSNLDYRISAFLNSPERYPLVVMDYYASGRWRDPGTRGGAYLFQRWCRGVYGDDLPCRLAQSNLSGVDNLETATQEHFAVLFRRWSVALLQGDLWSALNVRERGAPPFGRLLCGPCAYELSLAGAAQTIQLAGTAVAYVRLHGPGDPCTRITVTADSGTNLQVTLVPIPRPRLTLHIEKDAEGKSVRLILTAHGSAVELQDAAWERISPVGNVALDTSYRADSVPLQTVRAWFGRPILSAGETRISTAIPLPPSSGPLVWKVLGKTADGRAVAGWSLQQNLAPNQ
jgi:hypothetical protein